MGVFDPKPSFRGVTGTERMTAAFDMPYSFGRAFGENMSQGIVDSYGLGTAIRDLTTPSGNLGERIDNRTGYKPMFDPLGIMESGQPSLTEDEYKSSPYFRESVPFQPGLTNDRAAALAKFADTRAVRQYFSQKQPIAAFLGQFGGQALDPINYVPVFGQGAQLAAVARFGSIGGRALLSASEAAINTAAFGILTAGVRSRLGDDVSFEMIGTEIAMSALIGGAFGGGIGMLVRGRDARERVALGQARNALSTAANRQKAAIALNEQIDALATTGNPAATPNGMASIETVHTEVQRRVTAARSLDEQTAGVTGTKAGEVVIAPSGRRVSVVPEVVELDSLIHAEGALQVRNRRTAASDAQIEEIGATLDPARMMPNIDGSQGAPLVGADHIIDSGNGRVAGVRRAYEAYPEKAEAYRAFLAEQGYNVEGMQRPVLINRRVTNLDETARAQFNAELNGRTTASLGAVEIAQMDRAAMTDNVLDAHAPAPVTAASNRAFVQRFMAELPANDRQALLTEDGKSLSAEGVRRIENALFASAYGDIDPSAVRRFAEGVDDNTRSIVGAMSDMAGAWAKMRRDAKAGVIPQHLDQTQELTDALRLIGMWREQAAREGRPVSKVISEGMAQMDLLTGEIRPETQVFIRSFYTSDAFTKAQGREALAGQFADLIESGYELGRPSLFGDAMPEVSALQVLENAVRRNAETDPRPTGDALSRAEENGSADIEPAPGADRGLDRQSDEAGAEALAEADIFSHGADLGERPMSSADITDTMRERFENAGRPADEAEAAAGMLSTFYSTMAARTGRSINDLLKIAPLPEVRRGGQPDMSAQALAQSQPGNPAFDRWFGDSKVVDPEGKPLVVYHATAADFDAFKPSRGVTFLSLTPDGAMKGAGGGSHDFQQAGAADRIMPLYVRAEAIEHTQPPKQVVAEIEALPDEISVARYDQLREGREFYFTRALSYAYNDGFERGGEWFVRKDMSPLFKSLEEVARTGRDWMGQILPGYNTGLDADAKMGAQLAERGYDATLVSDESGVALVIADPTQIKSVNNRGAFDPNDPRILFQDAKSERMPTEQKVRKVADGVKTFYRGVSPETGTKTHAQGKGLYFTASKEIASEYTGPSGRVVEVSADNLPENPMRFRSEDDFGGWWAKQAEDAGLRLSQWNERWPDPGEYIRSLGHDGVKMATGKKATFVKFDAPRILFQPAWHGTPHIFDKFEWSDKTRGKGEGAQAFGDGLYFAGKKEVAEHYKNTLTGDSVAPAQRALKKAGDDPDAAIAAAEAEIARLKALELTPESGSERRDSMIATQESNIREIKAFKETGNWKTGRLYKVDIPEDSELLDWDAPLSAQPPKVQKLLRNLTPEIRGAYHAQMPLAEFRAMPPEKQAAAIERAPKKIGWFDNTTGEAIYNRLGRDVFGSAAAVSSAFRDLGIPGHRFLDGGSRGSGEGSYNYVIYDDSRVSITEFEQGARGSIEFGSDGRSVMSMFDAADASTALHESAHWFLQMFRSFADRADAPAEIRADWDRVRAWWTENADAVAADSPTGATGDDVRRLMETGTSGNRLVDIGIEVGMQEQWARGFEAYLREGVAPNEGLRGIFDQFKRWLTSIYRQALDLNVNINDDIRGVFDRLLAQQQGDLVPNSTAPKPDPVPDGLDAAAAAVRTPADPLKLGAQYGLDDAGGFAEQADIDALKASDMLTPEDQAMLDEADQLVADAEAYGKTLETAAWCMR